MKLFAKLLVMLLVFSACNNDKKSSDSNPSDIHEVLVQEVLHVREYSYIRVLENGQEKWIAAPITAVEIGGTYYIGKTMEMQNFESKDLNKTFETIYFVEKISTTAEDTKLPLTTNPHPVNPEATKPTIEKKEVKVETSDGSISLAELLKNRDNYNNKIVTLQGEVTKFNPAIMNINWIHMQDGTEFNGVFDLTVTTKAAVKLGDRITIKGKVTLNKDFGAGYFYNIIVENAEIIN
jgi:hypothetical protein